MTDQIPGVPDGWGLVHAMRFASAGEYLLDELGKPHLSVNGSGRPFPIIRKIEKPAKYRPFRDAEEAHPFWNATLRLAGVTGEVKNSWFRITTIGAAGITTNAEFYSYEAAFYRFYVDDAGTPFGVKIDE